MAEATRYAKTAKGTEEISQRRSNLRGRMRTMLILIDRTRTADELRAQAAALAAPPDFLETLVNEGYIAPVAGAPAAPPPSSPEPAPARSKAQSAQEEATRFLNARSFMNATAVNALGMRAFLFTLKLEQCATRADLLSLADDYEKVIRKGSGEAEAKVLVARLREMLG